MYDNSYIETLSLILDAENYVHKTQKGYFCKGIRKRVLKLMKKRHIGIYVCINKSVRNFSLSKYGCNNFTVRWI